MSLQNLYHTLSSIKTDRKTGKVYVYARENGSRRVGMMQVGLGEILGVNYSQKTGAAALERLLSLAIEEVVFMPRSDVDGGDGKSDALSISDVLIDLQRKLFSDDVFAKTLNLGHELRQEVEVLLKKIYGPSIVSEINKIAKSHPPDQNPNEFLNQCKAKAMLMLSKDQVEKIFRPLYEKTI
ncbi:MAG: hypothetical protein P9F19_13965 [Candidatus Contendobacter sp.]|nr:hypothetical protein [Candidatus Contendobacter sp.]MDG4558478.1 hypothetical protein [Candidatus Contendobacter sp.]